MAAFAINSIVNHQPDDDDEREARELLEKAFSSCLGSLPSKTKGEASLAYIGNVLIHAAQGLSDCFDRLVSEERLRSTGYRIVDQAYRGPNCHNMSILEYSTSQRKMLRHMGEKIHALKPSLEEVKILASPPMEKNHQELPRQPVPSESSSRSSISVSTGVGVFSAVASQASASTTHHYSDRYSDRRSPSPSSSQFGDEDDKMVASGDMDMKDVTLESLKHRGKGRYKCPYWRVCTKGGTESDGRPKIFSRNCMYRQHLQKHSKPHKCRMPGCPNREGFARKDQLVRHMQNVKHDEPFPLPVGRG
ncbi:hypothetical protein CSOJ01_04384 [Colletotrichum sojae]|uniref:C2H2-type domain-containing protein n=1 Tax=Colletotrichum sojae TaxID=2175907 RepID=A0A8H6JIG2_9PEZI|nr:hypothetical protein CSOJ01_04384 [Colletotrichum sojae]